MQGLEQHLLKKMANNPRGIMTLRPNTMGAAGERHRREWEAVNNLVRKGFAVWINDSQSIAQTTLEGDDYVKGS